VADASGPYLLAALLCKEVVIDEQGGSLHRLVSGAYEVAVGGDTSLPMDPLPVAFTVFVMLSAGDAIGPHVLELESPLFGEAGAIQVPLGFGLAHEIWSESIEISTRVERPGIYMVDVSLDGALLTRIPYHVSYRAVGYG
jgi:hypothetical protein